MNFPGVPPLLGKVANVTNKVALLVADAQLVLGLFNGQKPKWGIYLKDKPVIVTDNTISFDFKNDSSIAQYPMEAGAFQSYNKVANPFDARIKISKGGNNIDRQKFLDQLEAVAKSLELYDVATPEKIYIGASVQRYEYRRTATQGMGLITAEVWLLEIRQTVKKAFTNTATPGGSAVAQDGTVQATAPNPTQPGVVVGVQ